jgi:hypothetical protein
MSNPIFGYRASAELSDDSWKTLVTSTAIVPKDDVRSTFKTWEEEYKTETKLPLPGAWRSAKSVIVAALDRDIPLVSVDDPSNVRGKTAVEKDIKTHKTREASPAGAVSPSAALTKLWAETYTYANNNGMLSVLRSYIDASGL